MDVFSNQEYINIRVFDLLSEFYRRGLKINAQVNFSYNHLTLYKKAKNLNANFVYSENKIVNKKVLGHLLINAGGYFYKIYLTEDFDWVINVDNRILKKISPSEIDYIFYKAFEEI